MRRHPTRPRWMHPDCQMLDPPTITHHLTRALLLAEGWTAVLICMALVRARRRGR